MLNAFAISLQEYDLVTPARQVGLANYQSLVQDRLFLNSVWVTLVFIAASTAPVWLISLGLALLLHDRLLRASGFFKTVLVSPVACSLIALTIIWRLMYGNEGPLNATLLSWFGVTVPWLTSSAWSLPSVVLFSIWRVIGYYTILYLVGLQNIPREYYEAAWIDGAGRWATFRHITWHLLKPTTVFVIVISMINAVKQLDAFFVMTNGGPGDSTRVLALLLYETGFSYLKMGRAAAISVFLFAFLVLFTLLQLRLFRTRD
jgi:multiple sugar transport system permease protein